MRKRDIELIAALAEGTLEDETEARVLLAASPELQAEYRAHLVALDALSSVGQEHMTSDEKAAMHRDLWSELRAQPAATGGTPWYFKWGYAATALLVAVGLFGVLNTRGSDDAATEAVAEIGASDQLEESATPATAGASRNADSTGADDGAAEAMDGADAEAPAGSLEQFFAESVLGLRSGDSTFLTQVPQSDETKLAEEHAQCLVDAGLTGHVVLNIIEFESSPDQEGGSEIFLVAGLEGAEINADSRVAVVDAVDCVLVYVEE